MDRSFPFHLDNLDLIFSITGSQNDTSLWLPPIGNLRYLKGNTICKQLRYLEKIDSPTAQTPTDPIKLL